MSKLFIASQLLMVLFTLQNRAFAANLDCKFKNDVIESVKTIELSQDSLIINKDMEIPLEKSRVKCGSFGRQTRLDGMALGYQVVLKSCTTEAQLEGHLIDSLNVVAADVVCHQKTE